jgi:broad specificity phosphatase PhoE
MTSPIPELVFLARHGQTEWNVAGRSQGRLDSPLTPLGRHQVEHNARLLAALPTPIDAVFASPLGRARTCATILATHLGLDVHVLDALSELDHGSMSGLTRAEKNQQYPGHEQARAANKYTYRFPGGESYADAELNAALALHQVTASGARHPLLVSHEMIGRMLLRNLAGLDPHQALAYSHPSDIVYRVNPTTRTIDQITAGQPVAEPLDVPPKCASASWPPC